jgi:hypothetical protein
MFIEVYDDTTASVVWLFAGTTNTVDDHERWLSSMLRLDASSNGRPGAALLLIDEGNPPPSSSVRERLPGIARSVRNTSPLAVVTSSSVARGIIAGLDFTGVVRFPLKGFASVDDAIGWLGRSNAACDPSLLHELVDEARARSRRTASSRMTIEH